MGVRTFVTLVSFGISLIARRTHIETQHYRVQRFAVASICYEA